MSWYFYSISFYFIFYTILNEVVNKFDRRHVFTVLLSGCLVFMFIIYSNISSTDTTIERFLKAEHGD
jgi:hypothetical protein